MLICHGKVMLALLVALELLAAGALGAPGNVHLASETVRIEVPAEWKAFTAIDVDGKQVAEGRVESGVVDLGRLPIGYYEVQNRETGARVTCAVVAENAPVEDTPIAVDAAMSWFYADPEQLRDASALCRLAGVEWVRDRLSWPELQNVEGGWVSPTRYEPAMQIQHEGGLQILQVNHATAHWATDTPSRFPEDLQPVYAFYKQLAERWQGRFDAIEPWNEPDIRLFGGHTGCEIASFQKAAFLGLKAGDPELTVCQSSFAIDREATLTEFGENEVWPYFDRYALHHYIGMPQYARAYERHRQASGGRPLWTTEFNLPVHWADEATKEPSHEELRAQAFRVGKVFASALHQGSEKAFYFILGHYVERKLQYGLVHQDLTPRPAYVAFAAVGRLLNGARPLGRVDLGNDLLFGYLFETVVDGSKHETLVAWSETRPTPVAIPNVQSASDYLGRELPASEQFQLTRKTLYLLLPPGSHRQLTLVPPPQKPKWREGEASSVVLQLIGQGDVDRSAFVLGDSRTLRLVAYNFGDAPASGRLELRGATCAENELSLAPGERHEVSILAEGQGHITARLLVDDSAVPVVHARVVEADE